MHPSVIVTRVFAALAVVGLSLVAYMRVVRPQQLRWGATDVEVARAMPGDALSKRPTFLATRAITINATPDVVWPWLVQLGYARAGFYGYDILENIGSPRGIRSATRIVPELQQLQVGDPLPLSAAGGLVVNAIEPNRFLIWSGTSGEYPGAFTWALYPVDQTHTRLVSRIQWSHHWRQPLLAALDVFTEFTDHLAVRRILRGVKDRVEGRLESFVRQSVEFALLLWALIAFLASLGLLLRRPLIWWRWISACLSSVAWLVVWYAPLPLWFAAAINLGVLWMLRFHGQSLPSALGLVPRVAT